MITVDIEYTVNLNQQKKYLRPRANALLPTQAGDNSKTDTKIQFTFFGEAYQYTDQLINKIVEEYKQKHIYINYKTDLLIIHADYLCRIDNPQALRDNDQLLLIS